MSKGIRKSNFLFDNFNKDARKFLTKLGVTTEGIMKQRSLYYFKARTNNKDILFQIENWYINN